MLDEKDIHILELLQKDGRMTASEIASVIHLSIPAVAERIKKLVDHEIVERFSARLNAKKLGYDLTVFILVNCSSSDHYEEFVELSKKDSSILECHSITGGGSHLLKARLQNSVQLERLLHDIQLWPGVVRTHTMIVLSTYKETNDVDVHP